MKEIFVIGGGESLKNFDFNLLKDKTTIVSNKSIFDVPNADYFISTDYTFFNYIKAQNLYYTWKKTRAKKIFVANCIHPAIQWVDGYLVDTRFNLKYELDDFNEIIICNSAKSVGFTFDNFNSGYNSGFSSFQYALIKEYNPIYLLGLDMNCDKETHYHRGYGKSRKRFDENLKNYYPHFAEVLQKLNKERPNIKIISCSKTSKLNNFIEYKNIEEIL